MKINKIEVKNISYYKRGSEETPCYNATVYINGKKAVEVSNDGHGGSDRQHVWHENGFRLQEINEWCVAKFGKSTWEYGGQTYSTDLDLEHYCHDELYKHLDTKLLKRNMKKNIMFFRDENDIKSGQYSLAKIQNNIGGLMAYIKDKYPKSFILNDMPFEKALETFRSYEREM
tara:strand:- start:62 stop:580 length:519 start_codon:yes stop_codon:yes gene_type:complete